MAHPRLDATRHPVAPPHTKRNDQHALACRCRTSRPPHWQCGPAARLWVRQESLVLFSERGMYLLAPT